jgi:hypothetical protein
MVFHFDPHPSARSHWRVQHAMVFGLVVGLVLRLPQKSLDDHQQLQSESSTQLYKQQLWYHNNQQ